MSAMVYVLAGQGRLETVQPQPSVQLGPRQSKATGRFCLVPARLVQYALDRASLEHVQITRGRQSVDSRTKREMSATDIAIGQDGRSLQHIA
jgi:hypothetical protein